MATLKAKRGDHWRDAYGLVHLVKFVYPAGAFLLMCEDKVPGKAIGAGITTGPITCLECHDTSESPTA